jgi:DNA-binding MarR family transcriptional regulator
MPRPRHGRGEAAAALARTAPLVSRWIERLLAGHEPRLTVPQYLVLQSIDDGSLLASDLARRAAVSPAAISQLLDGLVLAGLVERVRTEDDRRRQPLLLTERGRAVRRSADELLRGRLTELLADLPPPETDALARLLAQLEHTLGGTAPPPRPHRPPPGPKHRRPPR